jgi:hypothetical protein
MPSWHGAELGEKHKGQLYLYNALVILTGCRKPTESDLTDEK